MNDTTRKGCALITGASSGIGAVYADRLAHRGYDLILVARNRERLNQLASHLTNATGRSVEVLSADLGSKDDLPRIEEVLRNDGSISMLVNNAGIGGVGPLLVSDPDRMEAMIELNVTALMRLTYAIAPKFVERGNGTVINISSIVAVAPTTLNGVYSGTKAFVLAFSQSLHHELADKGIRVQAVLPGATHTEFWDVAGLPVDNLPESVGVMSASDLVDAALTGLDQGELTTVPSLPDVADWNAFESARAALGPNLSRTKPAARYGIRTAA
jgi:uncharacterized protein